MCEHATENSGEERPNHQECQLMWDWMKHEDQLLYGRHTYFLIATSVILSTLGLSAGEEGVPEVLFPLFWLAGVALLVIWTIAVFIQCAFTLRPLHKEFIESDYFPIYSRISIKRKPWQLFAGGLTCAIPLLMLVIYAAVGLLKLCGRI